MSGMESLNREPGLTVELLNIVSVTINLITSIIVFEGTRLWKNSPVETCRVPEAWPWRQTALTMCPPPGQSGVGQTHTYSLVWAPPAP
jgi:hypothetical protein